MKILIVEDEENLARFLELELKYEKYDVTVAHDGETGLQKALRDSYDCILLDLMLPKMSGLEVCERLRKVKQTPIIMITAKGETNDKVKGLDLGADDYIVKPFDIEELLARLRVINRRNDVDINIVQVDDLVIDLDAMSVKYNSQNIDLTKTEYELLSLLVQHRNQVLGRDQIMEHVWGYDSEVETNVVDVYIRYLRNKLKKVGAQHLIETVRGTGYVIR